MLKTKIKYLGRHWKQLMWDVVKTTVAGFGLVITFSDALLNVLPKESFLHHLLHRLVYLPFDHPATLLIALAILVFIGIVMNWPTTKSVYKDPHSDLHVIVECCDIFEQDGLRVVHCVDTFDNELGRIINPRSVHGIFLKYCQAEGIDVEAEITKGLKFVKPTGSDENLPGKKDRYPLGTVCPVFTDKGDFCMVSFTHLQPNGSIAINRQEYTTFLLDMWHNLAQPLLRHDTVNVAVMGNRFVDLPAEFSTEQKIDLMIATFFMAAKQKACCKTLRICVHDSNMTEVDFRNYHIIIDHLAKRPII